MSFSSFTKERQFNPAQATSEANKILSDSQKLVDQMRAVNEYEIRAQSNLVTNLRQFRQDESRRDTRNNQLIIQGLKQRAQHEQRQAQIRARDKAQQIQENEAKLDAQINAFSDLAGRAGTALAGEINRVKAEVDEVINETVNLGYVLDPQTGEQDFLGAAGKLNVQKDQMLLETAQRAAAGKGKLFGLFDIVSDGYVKTHTAKHFALKTANEIQGGDLVRDEIRNNPDRIISIVNANGEEQQLRIGDLRTDPFLNTEIVNLAYKTIGFDLFKERMQAQGLYDGVDGAIFGDSFKVLNAYANTATQNFARFADNRRSEKKKETFILNIMNQTNAQDTAQAALELLNFASLDPKFSRVEAFKQIEDLAGDMPPDTVEEIIRLLESTGLTDFGNTNQAKSLRSAANDALATSIEKNNQMTRLTADEYVENNLLPLIMEDGRFDSNEAILIEQHIRGKVTSGEIKFDVGQAILERARDSYKEYSVDELAIDHYSYMINSGQMSRSDLDQAVRNNKITLEERNQVIQDLDVLDQAVRRGDLEGYTDSDVKKIFYKALANKIGALKTSAMPVHESADIVAARSVLEYQRIRRQNSKSMPADQAAQDALAQVLKAISDGTKGSIYEIGPHPLVGQPGSPFPMGTLIYSNVVPGGGGSAPLRFPRSPSMDSESAARLLKSRNSAYLQPGNPEYDLMIEDYAAAIRAGEPFVLSPRDQAIVTAAGIDPRQYVQDRFNINNIDLEVPVGSMDVLRNSIRTYPDLQKELTKPITLPRLNSVVEQLSGVAPADLGTGNQALGNAISISQKIGSPFPELVAARYMLNTSNNTNKTALAGRSPAQYLAELNKQLLDDPNTSSFTTFTPLNTMLAAVGDGDSLRGVLNDLGVTSRVPRAGMSPTIARMGNTGRINSTNLSADIAKGTSRTNLIPMIQKAAMRHNIPAPILAGLLMKETSFIEIYLTGKEKSDAGAIGAGQFLPATAEEHGVNPYDIPSSINGAAKYLRYLVNYFGGDMRLALYAYNGGMGNIKKFNGPIPGDKQNNEYVPLIMNFARRYGYGQ